MSFKPQRTTSDITRVLQIALTQKLKNPTIQRAVTILRVETSADLSVARVFIDIDHHNPEMVQLELVKATQFFKSQLAKNVELRRIPNISFIHDRGRQNAERVQELLGQIAKPE